MKKPTFDQVSLTTFAIIVSLASYYAWSHPQPKEERYIDYCGDSVYKRPGVVQEEGITPLLLPDKDVPKYENQATWIRPATIEERQILLRRYERRDLPSDHQLWTVTADAPPIVHTLARQYECTIEVMLDTSQ